MTLSGRRYATKNRMTCSTFSIVLLLCTPFGRHLPSTMSAATHSIVILNAGIASQMKTIAPTNRRFFTLVYTSRIRIQALLTSTASRAKNNNKMLTSLGNRSSHN